MSINSLDINPLISTLIPAITALNPWIVVGLLAALSAFYIFITSFKQHDTFPRTIKPPPRISSSISCLSFLGNLIQMASCGTLFLEESKKKYPNAFQISLIGQSINFLFSPVSIAHFFKAPSDEIAFTLAVEPFTKRVFGLPSEKFFPIHHKLLVALRNEFGTDKTSTLRLQAQRILHEFEQQFNNHPSWSKMTNHKTRIDLLSSIQDIVFVSSVNALFGSAFLEHHGATYIQRAFIDFESCFEHASSPWPHLFQPTFRSSRSILLNALKESLSAGHFEDTTMDVLFHDHGLPMSCAHNLLLAMLWASQGNTIPAAFWAVSFLLLPENKKYMDEIRGQIVDVHHNDRLMYNQVLIDMACDTSSLLYKCCVEALRLRSPSIDVRLAARDIIIPKCDSEYIFIKKNEMIAVCPYIIHTDPEIYEDPLVFNPYRQGMMLSSSTKGGNAVDNNGAVHAEIAGVGGLSGIAFGGM